MSANPLSMLTQKLAGVLALFAIHTLLGLYFYRMYTE